MMIKIDKERCIGCGACVSDCVTLSLALKENKAQAVSESCLLCGHCVAVCPAQAVEMDDYDMNEVLPYDKDSFTINPQQFLNHVKFRRSIRHFTGDKVEKDKLERIVEAGRFTATGSNMQDVRFTVIQDELEPFKELAWEGWRRHAIASQNKSMPNADIFLNLYNTYKRDPARDALFFNAPVALLVSALRPLNGGLAAANIENMAVAEGLGVLYNGRIVYGLEQSPEARQWLALGERDPVVVLLLGYSAVRYLRTTPHKPGAVDWR